MSPRIYSFLSSDGSWQTLKTRLGEGRYQPKHLGVAEQLAPASLDQWRNIHFVAAMSNWAPDTVTRPTLSLGSNLASCDPNKHPPSPVFGFFYVGGREKLPAGGRETNQWLDHRHRINLYCNWRGGRMTRKNVPCHVASDRIMQLSLTPNWDGPYLGDSSNTRKSSAMNDFNPVGTTFPKLPWRSRPKSLAVALMRAIIVFPRTPN